MQAEQKRIHFIAIGGSVMHNLAIALKKQGHEVSGSDDEIVDPSKSILQEHGLLPNHIGWSPTQINSSIDFVILGMHAKADNPELLKAQELNIPVFSFPEYIYNQSQDKQRIVIAGSHGKTTITAMVVHILTYFKRNFDYVIGARVGGLDCAVKLSDAPIIIIEGDEYLSSALDPVPKFLRYNHHVGVISGVAWDHANVFPTEEDYVKQFDVFADQTPKGGILIYCEQDSMCMMIGKKERADVLEISYKAHPHVVKDGIVYLTDGDHQYPIKIFGSHNMLNISAAKELTKKIGVTKKQFFEAISSFEGASGRLEQISKGIYKDFAHAPSKVAATIKALAEIAPEKEIIACLELHTYSSLSKDYLPEYRNSLKEASTAIVYFNPEKVASKGFPPITPEDLKNAFNYPDLKVFTSSKELESYLKGLSLDGKTLVLMSSGNFGGMDISNFVS